MAVVVAIVAVALVVWGAVFLRHTGLVGGSLAVLFVGSCFGHVFYHVSVGPIPVTADRVLLAVLLGAFLICRHVGRTERWRPDAGDLLLVAFVSVLAVATFAHDWRADDFRPVAVLLFFYVLPFVLYVIARETPLSERAVTGILTALAAFGVYLAVTAVCERLQIRWLIFPSYIASEEYGEFLGRGRGPLLNPAANGLFLCVGLFSLLMFWPRVSRSGKMLLSLLVAVYLAGVFCTLTRCVWAAAALGLFLIACLTLPGRWRIAFALTVTLSGLVFVATQWDALKAFKRDKNVSVVEMTRSAELRPILAYVAWQMFLDRPLAGCGLAQYQQESARYLSDRSTTMPLERARGYVQHNVVLGLLAETGAVGAGLYLALMVLWFRSAWMLWRRPPRPLPARQFGLVMLASLAAFLAIGMFQDLTIMVMVNMLMFFLVGTLRSLVARNEPATAHRPDTRRLPAAAPRAETLSALPT